MQDYVSIHGKRGRGGSEGDKGKDTRESRTRLYLDKHGEC